MESVLTRADELEAAGRITADCRDRIRRWLTSADDAFFVVKMHALFDSEDFAEIEDAFRKQVEFGTGGIRGKMGPGPNRINRRTIGEATQGLAQYVIKAGGPDAAKRGVVVAHDTRHNSESFAEEAGCILAGNGIVAHLFDGHRSTPELSYAVRALEASGGIMISASHNPRPTTGSRSTGPTVARWLRRTTGTSSRKCRAWKGFKDRDTRKQRALG